MAALTCSHCHEPCGVTGHFRRLTRTTRSCDMAGRTLVADRDDPNPLMHEWFGFVCRPGHTCWSLPLARPMASVLRMTAPDTRATWRDDPATKKQLWFLDVLGYAGPRPVTKGQAHDLLKALRGEDDQRMPAFERPRTRGIRIR